MPFELHFGCWGWLWISFGRPWGYRGHGLGPGVGLGPPEWAGWHSRPGKSVVLLGSRDPGDGQSVRWIWYF